MIGLTIGREQHPAMMGFPIGTYQDCFGTRQPLGVGQSRAGQAPSSLLLFLPFFPLSSSFSSLSFLSIILALLALVIRLCFPSQTPSYPPVVFIPSFVYPPTRSIPYLINPFCVRLLSLMPTTPAYQQARIQPGTLDYCWVKKRRLTATPLPDGSFTRG